MSASIKAPSAPYTMQVSGRLGAEEVGSLRKLPRCSVSTTETWT